MRPRKKSAGSDLVVCRGGGKGKAKKGRGKSAACSYAKKGDKGRVGGKGGGGHSEERVQGGRGDISSTTQKFSLFSGRGKSEEERGASYTHMSK